MDLSNLSKQKLTRLISAYLIYGDLHGVLFVYTQQMTKPGTWCDNIIIQAASQCVKNYFK